MLENLHGCRRRYNNLGTTLHPPDEILALVEMFICQLYQPRTGISQVKELRWHMFITNQAESDRLPPTQGALYEAILRAHYQIIVWNNDKVCCPSLPQPDGFGWEKREDKRIPVMTKEAPAPETIIQLVKCNDC